MAVTYTDIYGGGLINTVSDSYNAITFNANISLYWESQSQNAANTVRAIMNLNAQNAGLTVTLPPATLVSLGQSILINNMSNNTFALNNNQGNLIANITGQRLYFVYLTDNSTQGGTWVVSQWGQGIAAVTSLGFIQPATGMTITGTNPVTSIGTWTFTLANDLAALENLVGTGIAVRSANDTWVQRQITLGSANLTIQNPDGVGGNIILDLNTTLTGLNAIQVGNLQFQGNAITATNLNGIVQFGSDIDVVAGKKIAFFNTNGVNFTALKAAAGTTNLIFTLPIIVGGNNAIMQTAADGTLSFSTLTTVYADAVTMRGEVSTINPIVPATMKHGKGFAKGWALFNGTTGVPTIMTSYNANQMAKTGTGIYTFNFTNTLANANYVGIGTASNSTGITVGADNAIVSIQPVNSGQATITVTNAAGVFTDYDRISVVFYGDFA